MSPSLNHCSSLCYHDKHLMLSGFLSLTSKVANCSNISPSKQQHTMSVGPNKMVRILLVIGQEKGRSWWKVITSIANNVIIVQCCYCASNWQIILDKFCRGHARDLLCVVSLFLPLKLKWNLIILITVLIQLTIPEFNHSLFFIKVCNLYLYAL